MKAKETEALSVEELEKKILELKKELMKLNMQIATGTAVKSPGKLKQIKKNIARIKTGIKNKERKKQ